MKNKIYIDVQRDHVKVALTENDALAEFYVEYNSTKKYVGNIYKGKVVNVLQGMQAAFVDIGLEKNAYLYVGETMVDKNDLLSGDVEDESALSVSRGDEIMVQVVKDPFGTKGVRVTQEITFPGRFVVLMPNNNYVGISKKIENEQNRERLVNIASGIRLEGNMGFIIRTAAEFAKESEIRNELNALAKIYKNVVEEYKTATCPHVVYRESDIEIRAIRDMLNSDTEEIVINNKKTYDSLREQFGYLMPNKVGLFRYNECIDLIDEVHLTSAVEKILKRKVMLSNGAYLVIDRTEALTAIDVNSGKYVGDTNLEETAYNTNLVAADEIARQLRLRNIGGIIIVDFIDMDDEAHSEAVTARLREALKHDRIKTNVVGMTDLGLLQITRKKARSEVSTFLTKTCPYCHGEAVVLSDMYVVAKLRRRLYAYLAEKDCETLMITVHPTVFSALFSGRAFEKECETIWAEKRFYVLPDQAFKQDEILIEDAGHGVISVPDNAKLLY